MKFEPDSYYHIYNRGNNRESIFFYKKHYLFFLTKIRAYLLNHVDILSYCLMPNHFHLLVKTLPDLPAQSTSLNRRIGTLLSSYTQAINKELGRSGSLFQTSTKSKCLSVSDEKYFLVCLNYIHQNPLKSKIVKNIEDWTYSSYPDYAGFRNGSLPNIHHTFSLLDLKNSQQFVELSKRSIDPALVDNIY